MATSTAEACPDDLIPIERHRVGFDDANVGNTLDNRAQRSGETRVDLYGRHGRAGFGEGQGQRSEPGTDLDDAITGTDRGAVGDAPNGVGVGHEVLPEVAAWREVALVEQFADPLPRMRHRRTTY